MENKLMIKLVEKIAKIPYREIPVADRNIIIISILAMGIGSMMLLTAIGLAILEVKAES